MRWAGDCHAMGHHAIMPLLNMHAGCHLSHNAAIACIGQPEMTTQLRNTTCCAIIQQAMCCCYAFCECLMRLPVQIFFAMRWFAITMV